MDKNLKFLNCSIYLFLIALWSPMLYSQQLLIPWSQSMSNGSISLNLAMGEIYSATLRSESSIVSMGFYHGTPDSLSFTNDLGEYGYFLIYPNPAREYVTIKSDKEITKLELMGIDGKLHSLFLEQNTSFENTIQLPVQNGNYTLHIYSSNMIRPVVKQIIKI